MCNRRWAAYTKREISANPDFSDHILSITMPSRRVMKTLFRGFIIKKSEVCIRLYKAIIVPRLLYCVPVWRPFLKKHERMLKSVQTHFKHRLMYRCGQVPEDTVPDILVLLEEYDMRALQNIVRDGIRPYVTIRPGILPYVQEAYHTSRNLTANRPYKQLFRQPYG